MTETRRREGRAIGRRMALAAVPVTAYLVAMGLIAALWTKPPLLGWIGFGVLALFGAGIIVAAYVLFPRSRRNLGEVPAGTRRDGVLVLADATCSAAELSRSIVRHLDGSETKVHVVAPLLPEPLSYATGDEEPERADAEQRLYATLAELHSAGIAATGSVGTDDPVQSIGDALVSFPAAVLVVVTSEESQWLEDGLVERAHELVPVVEVVLVEPAVAAGGHRRPGDGWAAVDMTKLAPAERSFVEDSVEGHHTDAVVQATFGGGNPNRLLDFPNGTSRR